MTSPSQPGDDLQVGHHVIPASELHWSFGTSGGPGGQHANRSQTRAELRFDLSGSSAFPPELRSAMLERLGGRARDGVISVVSDETRSQWRNRAAVRRRLSDLLEDALRPPKTRRPTRPGRQAKARRMDEKRRRGDVKRLRRPPSED